MSAIYETSTVSLLQKFAESLQKGEEFDFQRAVSFVLSKSPDRSPGTVQTGLRSLTTNAISRKNNYRIVKGKVWQDGKDRDVFFQLENGLYRLYDLERDPSPYYYDQIEEDEEELRQEESIPDYGPKILFYPLQPETWPTKNVVYVIETVRRGIYTYVGSGKKRLKDHSTRVWFKVEQLVHRGWYIECEDESKRLLLEKILTSALKPLINKNNLDLDEDEGLDGE